MSEDYSNDVTLLREWLLSQRRRRPFLQRVRLWLRSGLSWRATKWLGASIHDLSKADYPRWGAALLLTLTLASCDYVTGPRPKYQACRHLEVKDSFALGDSLPVIHARCPAV